MSQGVPTLGCVGVLGDRCLASVHLFLDFGMHYFELLFIEYLFIWTVVDTASPTEKNTVQLQPLWERALTGAKIQGADDVAWHQFVCLSAD